MKSFILTPIKLAGKFILSNKRAYSVCALSIFLGVILGVYLVLNGLIEELVYAVGEMELESVILGEKGFFALFLSSIRTLVLPLIIIFVMLTNRFTKYLSFFYLGYQGLLLGASVASLVVDAGVAGILTTLFLVLPMNICNFLVLSSWVVVNYKRLIVARAQKLGFLYSLRVFWGPIVGVMIAGVISSVVYGLMYPLLLRSSVVVF